MPATRVNRGSDRQFASVRTPEPGTLVLSAETVKTCVSRILTKLNLRDRVQAVVFACQEGLVTPDR